MLLRLDIALERIQQPKYRIIQKVTTPIFSLSVHHPNTFAWIEAKNHNAWYIIIHKFTSKMCILGSQLVSASDV